MTNYNWKRFICLREAQYFTDFSGYLKDPDEKYGKAMNPEVVDFSEVSNIPCIALLGEPGIGKSEFLKNEKRETNRRFQGDQDTALYFDLGEFGNESRLLHKIFESEQFKSWKQGKWNLHLFLDSLDECLISIDTVTSFILEELKDCPIDRLFFRIACRTAEWPNSFEKGLGALWKNADSFSVYELLPLRKKDIDEVLEIIQIDSNCFHNRIQQMDASSLACKPVTLFFLVNTFQEFPKTRAELFENGCRKLCEEEDDRRRERTKGSRLSVDRLMLIAGRIAAITALCSRFAIWTGTDRGRIPKEDIPLNDLIGSLEAAGDDDFIVDESCILHTLNTGLFNSRGSKRIGWAHKTYEEFLAAWYINKKTLPINQIKSFIFHPFDREGKLVPQLHGVVRWLSVIYPEVFDEVVSKQPQLLLMSDMFAIEGDIERKRIVSNLLKMMDEGRKGFIWQKLPSGLKFNGIAEIIRPYIMDKEKNRIARIEALYFAWRYELCNLSSEIITVLFDTSESMEIREQASFALEKIVEDKDKARICSILQSKKVASISDKLKVSLIKILWPDYLSTERLFQIIKPPKNENLIDTYHRFISRELAPRLRLEDMQWALNWVASQGRRHSATLPIANLINGILKRAWEHLTEMEDLIPFMEAAYSRMIKYEALFGDERFSNPEIVDTHNQGFIQKRKMILEKIVQTLLADGRLKPVHLITHDELVFVDDIPWMITRLMKDHNDTTQKIWAELIFLTFRHAKPKFVNEILVACEESKYLEKVFSDYITPVLLGSQKAVEEKERWEKNQRFWNKRRNKVSEKAQKNSFEEHILKALYQIKKGNVNYFIQLVDIISKAEKVEESQPSKTFNHDICSLSGWKTLNMDIRNEIIEAAKIFILEADPENETWLGKNRISNVATEGYRAVRLLYTQEPESLSSLNREQWEKWAPAIIGYHDFNGDELLPKLVKIAYQQAPKQLIHALSIIIKNECKHGGSIFVLNNISTCWDERLESFLLNEMKMTQKIPDCSFQLCRLLLRHNVQEAYDYALETVKSLAASGEEPDVNCAICAAKALIHDARDVGWGILEKEIKRDNQFSRRLISEIARTAWGENRSILPEKLSDSQLGKFIVFLAERYPLNNDPIYGEDNFERDSFSQWRNMLMKTLVNRGTESSCRQIEHIIEETKEFEKLKWELWEARRITRMKTWIPPTPSELQAAFKHTYARLVRSNDELLEVIELSLQRYQRKLQGKDYSVQYLWNDPISGTGIGHTPKKEEVFANHIKEFLQEDIGNRGIVINREVKIRRGEFTDIHVDALIKGKTKSVWKTASVIIEVKGCWNRGLFNNMEVQLRDKYLKENESPYGLYVVGWFCCDKWDSKDLKRRWNAPRGVIKMSASELNTKLSEHSQKVAGDSYMIRSILIDVTLR